VDPEETHLVRRSQQGDREAFQRIVARYQGLAYNLAVRALQGDREGAQDTVQEAFLSAFLHIRQFRGGSLRAWLLRIVLNACRDVQCRARRAPLSLDEALERVGEAMHPRSPHRPEADALRRARVEAVRRAVDALPEEQRLAVTLVDLQGLDYAEAARVLGVPVGTLKSRLARGRARLRDGLLARPELRDLLERPDE